MNEYDESENLNSLFEMSSSLSPSLTGLKMTVWASPAIAGHPDSSPRIKVYHPPHGANPEAVYSIKPFGFVVGNRWLSKSQEEELRTWVETNEEVLLRYWRGEIATDEELRDNIISIQEVPPQNANTMVAVFRLAAPKVIAIHWKTDRFFLVFNKGLPKREKILARVSSALDYPPPVFEIVSKAPEGAIPLWPKR